MSKQSIVTIPELTDVQEINEHLVFKKYIEVEVNYCSSIRPKIGDQIRLTQEGDNEFEMFGRVTNVSSDGLMFEIED